MAGRAGGKGKKRVVTKIASTMAQAAKSYGQKANPQILAKEVQGMTLTQAPKVKAKSRSTGLGTAIRKSGWKRPGKRGIRGI